MIKRLRSGFVTAAVLGAVAVAAAPPKDAMPQAAPDLSAAALAQRLELVRQDYTSHDLAGARQELWALVDLVRAADQNASVRSQPAARGRLPRAGQDVPMPSRIEGTEPEYPIDAAKKGVIGYVVIDFVIAKSGKPRDFRVAHSIPALDRAALEAVRRWRYAKPVVGGAAADDAATVVLPFFLLRNAPAADELELARLFIEREDYAGAEAPLSRALAAMGREAACPPPDCPIVSGDSGLMPDDGRAPRLVTAVKPSYTRLAMNAKVSGTVLLKGIVDLNGRLICVEVSRSIPALDQAAIDAANQWRFEPAARAGTPVRMMVNLEISFKLK